MPALAAWAAGAALALSARPGAAAAFVDLKAPASPVNPGSVAAFYAPADAPKDLRLTGFQQEAGFYFLSPELGQSALLAVPLESRPGPAEVTLIWDGGLHRQKAWVEVTRDPYPRRRKLSVGGLRKKLSASAAANEKETLERADATDLEALPRWRGAFRWPLDGPVKVTSAFGSSRIYNHGQAAWRHKGVDLRARPGTPVLAANHGVVLLARSRLHATGGTVIVGHGYGLTTRYFHLSRVKVKKGQTVLKGDLLGYSGSTGLADGPHLHWEMELRGQPVRAEQWVLAPDPGELRP
jgi:hypothetical protein